MDESRRNQGNQISIHAPARGASKSHGQHSQLIYISIHAPARGASVGANSPSSLASNFNSRPCERGFGISEITGLILYLFQFTPLREGLRYLQASVRTGYGISIHAPARGASYQRHDATRTPNFNSRPCERGFSRWV